MQKKNIVIIGGGIGGLSSACYLAKAGHHVTVIEKNTHLGGRANIFSAVRNPKTNTYEYNELRSKDQDSFVFDMGPSWYLMPDIFEHFFNVLGENITNYLKLYRLDPSYRIFFKEELDIHQKPLVIDIHSSIEKDVKTLAPYEENFQAKIKNYLKKSEEQYIIAKRDFMYRNYNTVFDFFTWTVVKNGLKLNIFKSIDSYISKYFTSDIIKKILEYTVVFLGSSPYETPALYTIMNHIDFNMGVFYPEGGLHSVSLALQKIGEKYGVVYMTQTPVTEIIVKDGTVTGIRTQDNQILHADIVISNADLHFTETKLLDPKYQTYPQTYWQNKTMAPSGFILYLGLSEKIPHLTHHNLVFAKDWRISFDELFNKKIYPTDPSYYVCMPSGIDKTVAPYGKENLFVLVPVPSNTNMTEKELEIYAEKILSLMEKDLSIKDIKEKIVYKKIFSGKDFESMYNAYQGNALSGMAHTLLQTAIFRPDNRSKKVKNLYYVGAGTNPGIGVPICLISGELVYKRIMNITTPHPLEQIITLSDEK